MELQRYILLWHCFCLLSFDILTCFLSSIHQLLLYLPVTFSNPFCSPLRYTQRWLKNKWAHPTVLHGTPLCAPLVPEQEHFSCVLYRHTHTGCVEQSGCTFIMELICVCCMRHCTCQPGVTPGRLRGLDAKCCPLGYVWHGSTWKQNQSQTFNVKSWSASVRSVNYFRLSRQEWLACHMASTFFQYIHTIYSDSCLAFCRPGGLFRRSGGLIHAWPHPLSSWRAPRSRGFH